MSAELTMAAADPPQPDADPRVAIFASGVVAEDRRAEFLALVTELRQLCLADPGTLAWEWFSDRADPNTVWIYEEYADEAALDIHRGTALPRLRPVLDCFAEKLVAHRCVPLTGAR